MASLPSHFCYVIVDASLSLVCAIHIVQRLLSHLRIVIVSCCSFSTMLELESCKWNEMISSRVK